MLYKTKAPNQPLGSQVEGNFTVESDRAAVVKLGEMAAARRDGIWGVPRNLKNPNNPGCSCVFGSQDVERLKPSQVMPAFSGLRCIRFSLCVQGFLVWCFVVCACPECLTSNGYTHRRLIYILSRSFLWFLTLVPSYTPEHYSKYYGSYVPNLYGSPNRTLRERFGEGTRTRKRYPILAMEVSFSMP